MAETSGFYDAEELVSGEYDREYVSEQFAQYFALFIGNGVFASPTNQLKVVAGEGMNIVVKEGWAFIRGRWYHNDSDLVIPVPPNTTAATINSGVFVQHSQSDRDIHSIIATGRTTPDREAPYWELKIAELQIPTGTTAITDAMITDTRTDESVCGFVKGLLQGVIPTADLFAQYDAIFMDFYNRMKDQLSEDAAGHLQIEIDKNTKDISDVDGHLQIEIDNLSDSIAPQYDPSQTYGKGWVRMYHNKRYRSNQAITEPESWTPEHWTEENLDIALSEISDISKRLMELYPVGSIYLSANSTDPGTFIGGTWKRIKDCFLLAAGNTYAAGSTGGEATHTLTVNEMPYHTHTVTDQYFRSGTGAQLGVTTGDMLLGDGYTTRRTSANGSGSAHNNMPPYLTVYMWQRIA